MESIMKGIYTKIPKNVEAELEWGQGLKFVAKTGSKNKIILDAAEEHGGVNAGARPMEALLSALGGCTAMDLVTILSKKKRTLKDIKVALHGKRAGEHPHILEAVSMTFDIWGEDISDEDMQWAIKLSLSKYCSVSAMLEKSCKITYKWNIHK
jgi:putative redox protein